MKSRARPEEIVRLVVELNRTFMDSFDTELSKLNLTLPQAMLLHQLGEALPMSGAAGKLHCDPSNVTGIVDRLETRGLIVRQHLTRDRRVKHLVLTAEGRRLKRRVDAILSAAPGVSSLAVPEQAALHDLLTRSLHSPRTSCDPPPDAGATRATTSPRGGELKT